MHLACAVSSRGARDSVDSVRSDASNLAESGGVANPSNAVNPYSWHSNPIDSELAELAESAKHPNSAHTPIVEFANARHSCSIHSVAAEPTGVASMPVRLR